ncbi:hypothetical protein SYNTR_1325 [Candidatus Syntrophocurvum alkaliphilum]|uniref:Bypass of forespore C C-terminal domain-containing protein n=1 Tax=Candidatus Syntrophocurvum alkaliphilum TaxID=2293317 RepID=A0A6I6DAX1_9FIRM|nr:hypothetical protein [Candidatus Syntrophocurvum alkaliphilum]QGT99918.1 hypothetical protein SYNTR_1325 [Candidatus Syntrophocurvum alkaliphilum]
MVKSKIVIVLTLFLLTGFGAGVLFANLNNNVENKVADRKPKEPVVQVDDKKAITEETALIHEQKFLRCGHTIISEFKDHQKIIGLNIDEVKQIYTEEQGFDIYVKNDDVIIQQKIDDWCAKDKEKYRLKEYNGRVTVFKGPDKDHDSLYFSTGISFETLPDYIKKDILENKYEFSDKQTLHDALQNLDEYL